MINSQAMPAYDITLWTLTEDDYIVSLKRYTNEIVGSYEENYFCFICY